MKKNLILVFLVLVAIAGAGMWYFNNWGSGNSVTPPIAATTTSPGAAAASSTVPFAQAAYLCDGGKTIRAEFYKGDQVPAEPGQPPIPAGSVRIVLDDGRNFDLPRTISADGGRYANSDESFVFWDKGDVALVLENGAPKDYKNCAVSGIGELQELRVISPNGGEIWKKGQKVLIVWNVGEGIKTVNIRLSISGKEDGQSFNAAIASGIENTGSYEWNVQEIYAEAMGIKALPESSNYLLIVEDSDHNNIYDTSDAVFGIGKAATLSNESVQYPVDIKTGWRIYRNVANKFQVEYPKGAKVYDQDVGGHTGYGRGVAVVFPSELSGFDFRFLPSVNIYTEEEGYNQPCSLDAPMTGIYTANGIDFIKSDISDSVPGKETNPVFVKYCIVRRGLIYFIGMGLRFGSASETAIPDKDLVIRQYDRLLQALKFQFTD